MLVAVSNPLNVTAVGLVFAILHNSDGQTVANSSGALLVGPSLNGTATILVFGLRLGTLYSATLFALGVNGEGFSVPETVNLTPEEGVAVDGSAPLGTDTFGVDFCGGAQIKGNMPCEGYSNSSNSTIFGVAYLVLHNSLGQTVDVSTALIILRPGEQLMVGMPIFNPNGSASEFAVSVDQLAISGLATVYFQS